MSAFEAESIVLLEVKPKADKIPISTYYSINLTNRTIYSKKIFGVLSGLLKA